jgi:hypothetical protein
MDAESTYHQAWFRIDDVVKKQQFDEYIESIDDSTSTVCYCTILEYLIDNDIVTYGSEINNDGLTILLYQLSKRISQLEAKVAELEG